MVEAAGTTLTGCIVGKQRLAVALTHSSVSEHRLQYTVICYYPKKTPPSTRLTFRRAPYSRPSIAGLVSKARLHFFEVS